MLDDAIYAKLDPSKMGFRYLGSVPPDAQDMLRRAFADLKAKLGAEWDAHVASKEIFWLNVWQEDEDGDVMELSDPALASSLDAWCRTAVGEYCEEGAIFDGYGFVVNPVGSNPQVWHVDYTTDAAAVWFPITHFTDRNATQFIVLPSGAPEAALEQVASNCDQVDVAALTEQVDHLVVQQIAARPMSVLSMGRGTIHRGIANTGPDDRVAFYISVHFIQDYEANYPYAATEGSEQGVAYFAGGVAAE